MAGVRTVRAEWRGLPGRVHKAVTDIGVELHRHVLGDDLFLLALARLDPEAPAREVLEAEGATADVLLSEIRTGGDGGASPKLGMTYSPAYYLMHGRADGFAATLGDGTITPEHVLLAIVWDGRTAASQLLWRLGVSRQALVDGLRERGVAVPATPVPPQQEMDLGERVWFDRDQVQAVIDHVRAHVPPATHWGFNYEGDRAYMVAESSVDLAALVAEALPPAIEIRRLDHVQLAMPAGGEDDARAFYAGLLGFTEVPKPDHLAARGGCWFEAGAAHVHLGVDHDFRPARKAHPALLVRGLTALTDQLSAAGVAATAGDPGQVYVDDPFGNRVELREEGARLHGPP
ncbi:MAG TPA: Clp protease N-terminal domain-containing protein [Acidimicrobiales bacterium]|nr:Clp protease N-terminal domain-containing protein [Acidimicrobiales bacterium]